MEWRRKRKAAPTAVPVADEGDILKLTPLGAGNEVGRSCILLQYKGKTVMLDCGLHPAYSGLAALPFFDDIDPSSIDLILITHFHVDHAAGLPYFMEKTTFKGRVFMTHPTRAIYKWLLADYVKISSLSPDDQLYNENDLAKSFERIEVVDYHQEVDVGGIKFTPYNAGHVLGAAMFLLEIAGVRILYTGDYSREEDRHLMAAERPPHVTPEVLICESTYGVQSHEPRLDRETRFTRMVHTIVKRGGRCLLPVFALGRAQELLLILDEYWQAHPDLHSVPIYYASSLAKKCMTVYQTYTNMMNTRIREQIKTSNPFQFKHISNLRSIAHFDDVGPCVMMASPGMLQSGLSRELLELWCTDRRNGVIIPGYVVEGTLGKQILSQPEEIPSMNGSKLPLRLTVEYISFSAHVDYKQNSEFIEDVGSPNLVLVHGDSNEMSRLRSALQRRYSEREVPLSIFTPRNCETVELVFRGEKMAKVIGILAKAEPEDGTVVEGLLVSKDFAFQMMAPEDLVEFTDLSTANVVQRQSIATRAPFGLVKWHLEQMYGSVKVVGSQSLRVFDTVTVTMSGNTNGSSSSGGSGAESESDAASKTPHALLEWESNPVNDMIADTVLAVLLQADTSPASVKATKGSHSHSHSHSHKHADDGDKEHDHDHGHDHDHAATESVKIKTEPGLASDDKVKTELPASPSAPSGSAATVRIKVEEDMDESGAQTTATVAVATESAASDMPTLASLITKCLVLQFGSERVATGSKSTAADQVQTAGHVWTVSLDDDHATVTVSLDGSTFDTASASEDLQRRVHMIVGRALRTWTPLELAWAPAV